MTRPGASNRQRYRFGDFLLDRSARELRRAGALLRLSPKVFDCIAYLIEHRERAVGRDELIAAVWGRADVSDIQLGQLVRKVRQTVDDNGNGQTAVRTVPRFGFRWVAPIRMEQEPESEAPSPYDLTTAPATAAMTFDVTDAALRQEPRVHLKYRRIVRAVLAVVVALGGVLLWRLAYRSASPEADASAGSKSAAKRSAVDVVVLPVVVPAGDPEWAWMRLGLMDQIGTRLRNAGVAVVPSDNVVALTRDAKAADDLAAKVRRATGAQYLVQPTAVHSDSGWMLRVDLRSADGARRDIGAHAADPMSAARMVADQLAVALGGRPQPGAVEPDEWLQRIEVALMVADFATTRSLIESAPAALRDTPELRFSRARMDLTLGNFQEASETLQQLLEDVPAEAAPVLRANILRVLGVTTFRLGQLDVADQELTESVTALENLNEPAILGKAYIDRGGTRVMRGRHDEAAADLSRARVVLEPTGDALALAWIDLNEGALQSMRGHYAEALPLFERAELTFANFSAHKQLMLALGNEIDANLQLLRPRDAMSAAERAIEDADPKVVSADPVFRFQRIRVLIENGRISAARNLVYESSDEKDAKRQAAMWSLEAKLDLLAGQADRAAELARRAIAVLTEHEFAGVRAASWQIAIEALRRMHRREEAAAEVTKFIAYAKTTDIPAVSVLARLVEAEQARFDRRGDEAIGLYEDALRMANEEGVPASVAEVAVSYGNALLDFGDLPRASAVIGQVARWADRDFDSALLQARLFHAFGQRDPWRTALDRARALAGERPIPAGVIAAPKDALIPGALR